MIYIRKHVVCDGEKCIQGNPFNARGPSTVIYSGVIPYSALIKDLKSRGWLVYPEKGPLKGVLCPTCKRNKKK